MKKSLRNILVLSLGLITTIATAQWGATSETMIDNTNSDDRAGFSRTTLSSDWGGIHVSADVYYGLEDGADEASFTIYEAYASTDVMGFGSLTMGQQDLSYGSGALLSSGGILLARAPYTSQGLNLSTSMAGMDLTFGMFDLNNSSTYMNASGTFAGASVNILMMTDANGNKAHGYDLGYGMGDFSLSASMNSDYDGDEMTSYGLSYSGMSNLTIGASMTEYGDDDSDPLGGFGMDGSANNLGALNGNMGGPGGLANGDKNTTISVAYDLGDITFGYSRHSVENSDEGDLTDFEANSMSIGYTLNNNCSISIDRYGDDRNTGDDVTLVGIKITM